MAIVLPCVVHLCYTEAFAIENEIVGLYGSGWLGHSIQAGLLIDGNGTFAWTGAVLRGEHPHPPMPASGGDRSHDGCCLSPLRAADL